MNNSESNIHAGKENEETTSKDARKKDAKDDKYYLAQAAKQSIILEND